MVDLYLSGQGLTKTFKTLVKEILAQSEGKDEVSLRVINPEGSAYQPKEEDVIFNWGSRSLDVQDYAKVARVLNPYQSLRQIHNRVTFLSSMREAGVNCPQISENQLPGYILRDKKKLGEGRDIRFGGPPGINRPDKFWVEYIPKLTEYRVHIFDGEVVAIEEKVPCEIDTRGTKVSAEDLDHKIRTFSNGYEYKETHLWEARLTDLAKRAFGAIQHKDTTYMSFEILYSKGRDDFFVIDAKGDPLITNEEINQRIARSLIEKLI